jgi:cytosine/adenosine deaminase-related metal-dependent hydrolase
MLRAGVPLCLGTDSLASNDDLDVLAEIPELARAFPQIPVSRWLEMATRGGAEALQTGWGVISPGRAPGLVLLEGVEHVDALADTPPTKRTWIARPGDNPWAEREAT